MRFLTSQKIIAILFVLIITFIILTVKISNSETNGSQFIVFIDNNAIFVEIANDQNSRAKGLSERTFLQSNQGMLFIFPEPGIYSFWMKDMNFALDIIWLDENKKIIGIEENVPPLENSAKPKFYLPPEPVKYVLEVNAGLIEKYNIQAQNSKISFENISE